MNKKDSFYEYMYNYEYDEYYEFDEEVVNPVVEIIKKYDNFQKKEELKQKALLNVKKIKKHKFIIMLVFYVTLFIGVSIFKMNALYKIVDLNMKLGDLDARIYETQKVLNSLENKDQLLENNINLRKIENESKKMGFTDEKKIEYVHFEK